MRTICAKFTLSGGKTDLHPIIHSTDAVHVIARAMGYPDRVAFAFGVLSGLERLTRVTEEYASKVVQIADILIKLQNGIRVQMPSDQLIELDNMKNSIRKFEEVYSRLTKNSPDVDKALMRGYQDDLAFRQRQAEKRERFHAALSAHLKRN